MKAVQLVGVERVVLQEMARQPLVRGEVRIRMEATCVCGSDLKNFRKPVVIPQILGHEFSGTVLEIGPKAQGKFCMGDRVTVFPMRGCFQCQACLSEKYEDCENKNSLGFQLPGSFAEEVIVDERQVIPLFDEISFEQGALLEHLCCGLRLAQEVKKRNVSQDASILIIGDGPIALADIQFLKILGFENLTLMGKHKSRTELAQKLGVKKVLKQTQAISPVFDICIYAAPAPDALEQILPSLKSGGIVFPQTRISSDSILAQLAEKKISQGRAFAYSLANFGEVMELIIRGVVKTDSIVSTRLKLNQVADEFLTFFEKDKHIKILITR